jgi:hypothetical protein
MLDIASDVKEKMKKYKNIFDICNWRYSYIKLNEKYDLFRQGVRNIIKLSRENEKPDNADKTDDARITVLMQRKFNSFQSDFFQSISNFVIVLKADVFIYTGLRL